MVFAQNGLEKIIVEKYYISDSNDAKPTEGNLPVGSVTYRIFVDMLPYYKFQAAFGIPGHQLFFKTTTLFFNNEFIGGTTPNVIPDQNLMDNTVMLDSWLSVGGASEGNYGILKSDDDINGTIINANKILQNADSRSGIPIKVRDGLIKGTPPRVTEFGIDSSVAVFNNRSIDSIFSTSNGSWASLYGSMGPDSITNNRVLIAQLTTDGVFSFELNIQIGTPYGGVEQYVARNPTGEQVQLPSLTYSTINDRPKRRK